MTTTPRSGDPGWTTRSRRRAWPPERLLVLFRRMTLGGGLLALAGLVLRAWGEPLWLPLADAAVIMVALLSLYFQGPPPPTRLR